MKSSVVEDSYHSDDTDQISKIESRAIFFAEFL
jgi:hypothetical protein